ncbi:MAG: positive regulator of CheA protein [Pseudomonadota bacterium]|jgi:purine-binding chemotaxis protein CheW
MTIENRFLMFTVAKERYAIALSAFREVVVEADITPVPFAPDSILGIMSVRGQMISVFDLRTRLGLQRTEKPVETSLLILESRGERLAMSVDSVENVFEVPLEQLTAPPAFRTSHLNFFAEAVTQSDRQFIVILNSEKLFSFEESFVTGGKVPLPGVA